MPIPLRQNLRDLKAQARRTRNLTGRVLYNAGDEERSFTHAGVPYTIPPNGTSTRLFHERRSPEGELISKPGVIADHETYQVCDGTLVVYKRYGVEAKKARAHRKARYMGKREQDGGPLKPPPADKLLADDWDIAQHALKKLGNAGVVLMEGDPKRDAELKEHAYAMYILYKREQAQKTVDSFHGRNARYMADPRNSGKLALRMNDREKACQMWLDRDAASDRSKKIILCPDDKCGFDCEAREDMDIHVRSSHPRIWLEQNGASQEDARNTRAATQQADIETKRSERLKKREEQNARRASAAATAPKDDDEEDAAAPA